MKRFAVLAVAGLVLAACGSSSGGAAGTTTTTSTSTTTTTSSTTTSTSTTTTIAPTTTTRPKPVVPTQSPLLAGNAHPHYPAGVVGQVSVVYQAPISPQQNGTTVPIVLVNESSSGVAHVDIAGTAKNPKGEIVGSGNSQGTDPSTIQPGQWALAYIFFESAGGLSSKDTMTFSISTMPADTSSYNTAAIQVTQANLIGGNITGGVKNTTGHPVVGPISVDVYCFDSAGHPMNEQGGFTSGSAGSSGNLAANATDSFQIDFYGQQCSSYLVGASGFYP